MTKNQINYLLALATLFVLGFYVNAGFDIFMRVKLSKSMASRQGVFEGAPRFMGQQPRFNFPQGIPTTSGVTARPQMAQLPADIQKFLAANKKAAQTPVAATPVSEKK